MTNWDRPSEPVDAAARRSSEMMIAYAVGRLPAADAGFYNRVRQSAKPVSELIVPPRDGRGFRVRKGQLFRVVSIEGPQVGDLNLWNADNLSERFFSGKTRQIHRTHVTAGDRLWSSLPYLRPMATITSDTLGWYGFDADGGGIHDVIGTRCDPYTGRMLTGRDYHQHCHSNLARGLAGVTGLPVKEAEMHVHDVLNIFMCTGFTKDTHQYFMKPTPVRPGDAIEFFAEMDLICSLSACPDGDCGASHAAGGQACFPLKVEILQPSASALKGWSEPPPSAYSRTHGV